MRAALGGIYMELESITQYLEVTIAALDFMKAEREELPPALAVIIHRHALAPLRQQLEALDEIHKRAPL